MVCDLRLQLIFNNVVSGWKSDRGCGFEYLWDRTSKNRLNCYHVLYSLVPESARWLMSKGRIDEAVVILTKAATVNGKQTSLGKTETLLGSEEDDNVSHQDSFLTIFKHPRLVIRALICFFNWWDFLHAFTDLTSLITVTFQETMHFLFVDRFQPNEIPKLRNIYFR